MNVSAVHKTHAKQNKWPVESLIAENIMFPSTNANCQMFSYVCKSVYFGLCTEK